MKLHCFYFIKANTLSVSLLSGGTGNLRSSNTLGIRVTPTGSKISRLKVSLTTATDFYFDNTNLLNYCKVYASGVLLILNTDFFCTLMSPRVLNIRFSGFLSNLNYDLYLTTVFPSFYETTVVTVYAAMLGIENVV